MSDGETRREFLEAFGVASISILGGCQTSGDSDTQTPTPTKTPTSTPTDTPTSTPTETATPETDDVFEDMTPYEQAVNDLWSREGVNENVADEHQRMFDEGDEIEALEKVMKQGVQEGLAQPAAYLNEGDYLESGPVHSIAKAVELYGEEDPDNTQEALGLHRLNVDVKRVSLDGVETDVAIVEDTKADETVLATNYALSPGKEGPEAAAYRVGTEAEGATQELLKGLTEPTSFSGTSVYDIDAIEGITTGDINNEKNARYLSKMWTDFVAGAEATYKVVGNTEVVGERMLVTMDYLQEISEGETEELLGLDYTREITNRMTDISPEDGQVTVLGRDEAWTGEYDFSQGIPLRLTDGKPSYA